VVALVFGAHLGVAVVTYSVGHYMFNHHADGLIDAVKKAAKFAKYPPDSAWHSYEPYYGDVVGRAVWQARFVCREARRLGLLDPEPVDVRVLLDLDVMAGEAP
jgi:hypothetical protein